VAVINNLVRSARNSKGVLKEQLYVIQLCFAAGLIAIIITNALLPFMFGYFGLTNAGSFFSALFVIGIAYSVLKHKLFDLRLIVARSLAYVFALSTIVLVYGLIVFGIFATFGGTKAPVFVQQIFYLTTAVFLGFAFPTVKRFFDKVTNKTFYRDAYEPQELLNNLNQVLVSTIELNKLLTNAADIIGSTLKSEYCVFHIKKVGDTPRRTVGTADKSFDDKEIDFMGLSSQQLKLKTLVTDELEEGQGKLKEILSSNNIAVVTRLTSKANRSAEGLGYIILGAKKSGGIYSVHDIRILEIIADELVIAIQNALRFEEIENFNITLQEKVNDATRQLRRTNEKLKQLDETKDEFISMASHQLRTPLTSMKGYVSMVMEGDAGKVSATQAKLLDQAFVSSQRMVYLISDLLNVSRLKTGKFIIEAKPTNLADVVEGEIAQLRETAKGRGLELTYNKPENFPLLSLDETKIRQVIMNFADNAIYYTKSGGHIVVSLVDKPDSVEFTVADDGIGVPRSEQHHLFSKFYRAGNAKKARPDGTGLGLFMAKKVIAAQGGSIIFHSEEGKGSTFGFSFPKAKLEVASVKKPKLAASLAK
jgi:signal transduction histidine kinase